MNPISRVGQLGRIDPSSPFTRQLVELGALPKPAPQPAKPPSPAQKRAAAAQKSAATLDGLRWLSPQQKLEATMAATTELGSDASPALKATERKLLAEARDRALTTRTARTATALATLARVQAPAPEQAEALGSFASDVRTRAQRAVATPAERSAAGVAAERKAVSVNARRDATDGIGKEAMATARKDPAVVRAERPVVPRGDATCVDVNVGVLNYVGTSSCQGINYEAGKWRDGWGIGADVGVSTMFEKEAVEGSSALLARAKASANSVRWGGEAQSRSAADGTWQSLTGKAEAGAGGVLKVDVKGSVNSRGGGGVGAALTAKDLRMGGMVEADRWGEDPAAKAEVSYRKTAELGLGAVAFAGREVVTEVRARPKPDRDLEQAQFEATGKVPGSVPGPEGTLLPPSAQWEKMYQEDLSGIRAEQAATDAALAEGFRAAHPARPEPDAERLRVDRVARADGVNTESAAYQRGGWVQQAREQQLDEATVTRLRIDSGMRSGPDGIAAR